MKGYAGREDDAALGDGWRATGDLGWVDDEGYVFFAGRKDDMIIRGGENIAPAEVETVLMSHPAVDEAAVIGVPSRRMGSDGQGLRGPRARAHDSSHDELIDYCRSRLASFKRPESVEFVDALPKNPLGKILRKDLRRARRPEYSRARSANPAQPRTSDGAISTSMPGGRLRHRDSDPPARRAIGSSPRWPDRSSSSPSRSKTTSRLQMLAITGRAGAVASFCAGFDADVDPRLVESLATLSKPTLAIVNGDALDEGLELRDRAGYPDRGGARADGAHPARARRDAALRRHATPAPAGRGGAARSGCCSPARRSTGDAGAALGLVTYIARGSPRSCPTPGARASSQIDPEPRRRSPPGWPRKRCSRATI